MKRFGRNSALWILPFLVSLTTCSGIRVDETAAEEAGPLALYGNMTALEIGPVLLVRRIIVRAKQPSRWAAHQSFRQCSSFRPSWSIIDRSIYDEALAMGTLPPVR